MSDVRDEWLPIGESSFRQQLSSALWATTSAILAVMLAFQLGIALFIGAPPAVRLPIAALVALAVFLGIVIVGFVRNPTPCVNPARRQIRAGRQTIEFSAIDTAVQGWQGRARAPNIFLAIGPNKGRKIRFLLRYRGQRALDEIATDRLIAVIEASVIAIPIDPYDPKGKFADSSFGLNLDRERAIDFVRETPVPVRRSKNPAEG